MAPAGVLTVADLLTRNASASNASGTPLGVSVGSLLRREGRAPHRVDRPVQPRTHQQSEEPDVQPAGRRAIVRRSAVAAGTLLAASSVFGAAVINDASFTTAEDAQGGVAPTLTGSYPGQGMLDEASGVAPPAGAALIAPAPAATSLDPGDAAPSSWNEIAFPGGTSARGGAPAGGGGTQVVAAPVVVEPATSGIAPQGGTEGVGGSTATLPTGTGTGGSGTGGTTTPSGSTTPTDPGGGDGTVGGAEETVRGLGGTPTAPLKGQSDRTDDSGGTAPTLLLANDAPTDEAPALMRETIGGTADPVTEPVGSPEPTLPPKAVLPADEVPPPTGEEFPGVLGENPALSFFDGTLPAGPLVDVGGIAAELLAG